MKKPLSFTKVLEKKAKLNKVHARRAELKLPEGHNYINQF